MAFDQHLSDLMTPRMLKAWPLILEFTIHKLQQGYFGQAKLIIEEIDDGSMSLNSVTGQLVEDKEEEEVE